MEYWYTHDTGWVSWSLASRSARFCSAARLAALRFFCAFKAISFLYALRAALAAAFSARSRSFSLRCCVSSFKSGCQLLLSSPQLMQSNSRLALVSVTRLRANTLS